MDRRNPRYLTVEGISSLGVLEGGVRPVQGQPSFMKKKFKSIIKKLGCTSTDTAQSGQKYDLADHWMMRTSVERLKELNPPVVLDQVILRLLRPIGLFLQLQRDSTSRGMLYLSRLCLQGALLLLRSLALLKRRLLPRLFQWRIDIL